MLIDRKPKHQLQVLTEEKLDEIGAHLEQLPHKSIKPLKPSALIINNACSLYLCVLCISEIISLNSITHLFL
jgi:hypothetical protein